MQEDRPCKILFWKCKSIADMCREQKAHIKLAKSEKADELLLTILRSMSIG